MREIYVPATVVDGWRCAASVPSQPWCIVTAFNQSFERSVSPNGTLPHVISHDNQRYQYSETWCTR